MVHRVGGLLVEWVLALLVLAGCNGSPFAPAATATPSPSVTPTAVPTHTPTGTRTPTHTSTPTWTRTPTSTPTPTPTPRVWPDECRYVTWLATGLLRLQVASTALQQDESALHNTTIFDSRWRQTTLTDLAAERDAAAVVAAGSGGAVPPTLADLDRESRAYSGVVQAVTAEAYTGLSNFDPFAFNNAYQQFDPLAAAGMRLLADLDSWARGRSLLSFADAATTACR